MGYFYGPVPSRRLGFSLGVDIIPKKTCSFDCVYCQLGMTTKKTIRRFSYVDLAKFKKELRTVLVVHPDIDYITIAGSGEPTLHKNLDTIIRAIKEITRYKYPVCVITNSSLLYRKDVRKELMSADVIIPSLDAVSSKIFHKINNPCRTITVPKIIDGLMRLRKEFKGKIWLEIMFVGKLNDSFKEAYQLRKVIERLNPDKVQLNIPVRPAGAKILLTSSKQLRTIKEIIGVKSGIVFSFDKGAVKRSAYDIKKEILAYVARRPATIEDLHKISGLGNKTILKQIKTLVAEKIIKQTICNGEKYLCIHD